MLWYSSQLPLHAESNTHELSIHVLESLQHSTIIGGRDKLNVTKRFYF